MRVSSKGTALFLFLKWLQNFLLYVVGFVLEKLSNILCEANHSSFIQDQHLLLVSTCTTNMEGCIQSVYPVFWFLSIAVANTFFRRRDQSSCITLWRGFQTWTGPNQLILPDRLLHQDSGERLFFKSMETEFRWSIYVLLPIFIHDRCSFSDVEQKT